MQKEISSEQSKQRYPQKEVDEIREKMQAEGKSRQEIQEALMHYDLNQNIKHQMKEQV